MTGLTGLTRLTSTDERGLARTLFALLLVVAMVGLCYGSECTTQLLTLIER